MWIVRLLAAAMCTVGLVDAMPALAQDAARTQAEVRQLLDFVGASSCQFERNGKWHDAGPARSHLERKYDYLRERKLVPNAEAFIARAATESSLSGKPYRARCGDAQPIPSAQWLSTELKRVRVAQKQSTS
ncbi:YfeK family protein [Massilia haematophila]|uniref:DUF5329 domain-containing protein n=1 Tax=Massilia haematophila TaxID=457923 RepID=A0ABV7PT65_9BURK|nr:hypothetical protein [Massilia sp.]